MKSPSQPFSTNRAPASRSAQYSGARRGSGHHQSQQGQALTEFIVIALALVPLFLLMPVIAKYQDIVHTTQIASRYVAFDGMTRNDGMSSWKPVNQLAGEVRRRFFSNSNAPIKTNDTAGNFNADRNLFWRDPRGNALIKDFDNDVKISFGPSNSTDRSGAFSSSSDGNPFTGGPLVPFNVHETLGLQAQGVYTAHITVTLADLPSEPDSYTKSYDQFKSIGLAMTRHTSLLVDSWAATEPAQVESRIDKLPLFPGSLLAPVKPLVDAAVAVMESPKQFPVVCDGCGPKLGELEFWRDIVPADRVKVK